MTIDQIITSRSITEILHFTPHSGLLGILHSGQVLSRDRLPAETELEHIYKPNADIRRDSAWLDYVNLSLSAINHQFFSVSCRWHRASDLWWCILGFSPEILSDDGVLFTTTNNMYSGVKRASGPEGLSALFQQVTELWVGNDIRRPRGLPDNYPTCPQAEALYPRSLSTRYLKCIYVTQDTDADEVSAQLELTGYQHVAVVVDNSKFVSDRGSF